MNFKLRNYQEKAFTLNELMMVMAIVVILSVVAITSLWGSRERKEVETAAREVAAALRETQNYALTGKGVTALCTSYALSAPSASTYMITLAGSDASCVSTVFISYNLKNNVAFTARPTTTFSTPHGSIGSNSSLYKVSKGSTVYSICACASGRIEESNSDVDDCSTVC